MQNAIKNENEHQQETIIQLKNTKQTVKNKSWSKSSGTCSSPQFLWWSIHFRRFLSAQSFATLVLTGTTLLAAMTAVLQWHMRRSDWGFSGSTIAFFRWRIWRKSFLITVYCCSRSLHLPSTVYKNARQSRMVSADQLADDTLVAGWRNRKNGRLERSAVRSHKALLPHFK